MARHASALALMLLSSSTFLIVSCRTGMSDSSPAAIPPATEQAGISVPEGREESLTLVPFSGRFGYGITGPRVLEGAITKDNLTDQEWHLDLTVQFPSSGYELGEPLALVRESSPEQVEVRIPLVPPPPDSTVLQVLTPQRVTTRIAASNEATFTVILVSVQP